MRIRTKIPYQLIAFKNLNILDLNSGFEVKPGLKNVETLKESLGK